MPRRRYKIGMGGQETTDPYDEQRRKNQIAADQYTNSVRQMQGVDTTGEESEPARLALAKALGESTDTPLGPLMARFRSLPPNVQAGIYRQGGAQFIGGTEGSKLLTSLSANTDKAIQSQIGDLGQLIATGKIQIEKDANGKPSFYTEEDDPSDPAKLKKKKVPLNDYQNALLKRGFANNTLLNPWNPAQTDTSINMPRPQTTDEFQQVLNQRAAGGSDVDAFQRILNARAVGREGVLGPKPMVTSEPTSTIPMDSTIPQIDPFLAANKFIRSIPNRTVPSIGGFLGDIGNTIGDVGTSGLNMLARVGAAGVRLGTGADVRAPQIPLLSEMTPEDPRLAEIAKQEEARRIATQMGEFGY